MIHSVLAKLPFLAAAFLILAGCSQSDSGAAAKAKTQHTAPAKNAVSSDKGRTLTYYLDQKTIGAGDQGVDAQGYKDAIKLCKSAGITITPLSAADEAKLAIKRMRRWQEPGRLATETDTWDAVIAPYPAPKSVVSISALKATECNFIGLKETSKVKISIAPNKFYFLKMTTGPDGATESTGTVLTDPNKHFSTRKKPITPEKEAMFERTNAHEGMIKRKSSTVAGQPCINWENAMFGKDLASTDCIWSGGKQWGWAATEGGLALSTKDQYGETVMTTTQMIVGHLPDDGEKIFDIPKNIRIRDVTPRPASDK